MDINFKILLLETLGEEIERNKLDNLFDNGRISNLTYEDFINTFPNLTKRYWALYFNVYDNEFKNIDNLSELEKKIESVIKKYVYVLTTQPRQFDKLGSAYLFYLYRKTKLS